eukprot:10290735-Ditylum_brightwellii.AAC.2
MDSQKFGYISAPLDALQTHIQQEVNRDSHLAESFSEYISSQPHHVWQLLGTLDASDVDVEYWIRALNNDRVTIVTDGSVAQKTGYFANFLLTPECQLWS